MSQSALEAFTVQVAHIEHDFVDHYAGRSPDGKSMADVHHPELAPDGDIEVGYLGWLGNPYTKHEYGRERCIELFRRDFERRLFVDEDYRRAVAELSGHTLACWCQRIRQSEPKCHATVIAEWAEKLAGWYDLDYRIARDRPEWLQREVQLW